MTCGDIPKDVSLLGGVIVEARNRQLPDWFQRIETHQITLPRFQRREAWGPTEIADLLRSVLHGLPVGAALTLEVGDLPQFTSRAMEGAPDTGERVGEQLLDGQQRLTALWRSINDNYRDHTYFVQLPEGDFAIDETEIIPVHRSHREGKRYPLWADNPLKCWMKRLVPVRLLCPGHRGEGQAETWIMTAADGDIERERTIRKNLHKLRERVAEFNLPFLELPRDTAPDVAVDVFIKLNTRMVRLTAFDVVVAQFEEKTEDSLHNLVSGLKGTVPQLSAYAMPENIVLSATALLQDKVPNQRGYFELDLPKMAEDWGMLVKGAQWTVRFLEDEKIFDGQRLPTVTVIAPLVALHQSIPNDPDARGNAMILMRKYLWRSFFTDRYESSVAPAILQDYRALRNVLTNQAEETEVPCFDEEEHPLPDSDALTEAGWPRRKDRLARAVLMLSLRGGAEDIADGTPVSRIALSGREYHHLFPVAHLRNMGIDERDANRALNCALISWRSNRKVSAARPLDYLRERAGLSQLGEEEIRRRLQTHSVSFDDLSAGNYEQFLEKRARMALAGVKELCNGRPWQPSAI